MDFIRKIIIIKFSIGITGRFNSYRPTYFTLQNPNINLEKVYAIDWVET